MLTSASKVKGDNKRPSSSESLSKRGSRALSLYLIEKYLSLFRRIYSHPGGKYYLAPCVLYNRIAVAGSIGLSDPGPEASPVDGSAGVNMAGALRGVNEMEMNVDRRTNKPV